MAKLTFGPSQKVQWGTTSLQRRQTPSRKPLLLIHRLQAPGRPLLASSHSALQMWKGEVR